MEPYKEINIKFKFIIKPKQKTQTIQYIQNHSKKKMKGSISVISICISKAKLKQATQKRPCQHDSITIEITCKKSVISYTSHHSCLYVANQFQQSLVRYIKSATRKEMGISLIECREKLSSKVWKENVLFPIIFDGRCHDYVSP